jgi:arylsulfatase A-like enzyme
MKRPNLLVFLTDDHGAWAAGCYGARSIRTPTLDWLAATGTRLDAAYTPCPVCSPARASFWTGQMPSQHGIHDWIYEPGFPDIGLPKENKTLAELLSEAGYRTGFVGKWHCGASWLPKSGFDYYLGENKEQYPHRGICKFTENGTPVEYIGQRSAFVTQKAVDFLQKQERDRPFFLFVGYTDTHSPFKDHPERLVGSYSACTFPEVPREKYTGSAKVIAPAPSAEAERRKRLAQYFAAVSYIDEQVGQVLDALSPEELDNTLVVYTSDHGHMNGHHGLYAKGNATVPQNFYEESIRIPCLVRWPGTVGAGKVSATTTSHCDLFATLLDAAGLAAGAESPGRSVLPRLKRGARDEVRDAFCEYGNARMIRRGRYKLIVRYAPHVGDELYDLEKDPRETRNLIGQKSLAPTIAELRAALDAFFARYSAPGRAGVDPLPRFNGGSEPWA